MKNIKEGGIVKEEDKGDTGTSQEGKGSMRDF